MTLFRLLVLSLLLAVAALSQTQEPEPDPTGRNDDSYVYVTINVSRFGTLEVRLESYVDPDGKRPDLGAILAGNFNCVNRPSPGLESECRVPNQVPADGTDHSIDVSKLATALKKAGFGKISASVWLTKGEVVNGGNWESGPATTRKQSLYFNDNQGQLPSAFRVKLDRAKETSPAVPVAAILIIPIAASLWIRRSGTGQIVWIYWLVNAIWFTWIFAWDSPRFGELLMTLPWANEWVAYLIGVVVYALPPLAAISATIYLLNPTGDSLRTIALQNALQMVPLAFFFGAGISQGSMLFAGAFLGYIAHHVLSAMVTRHSKSVVREVVAGEWFDQIRLLGAKAGVKLQRLLLHRSEASKAVNAFALPGNQVMLSEALLEEMSRREVEAVVGHEFGHLKKNDGAVQTLFWILYFVLGASLLSMILPDALQEFPLALIVGMAVIAQLSQFHEFRADAFSARLTGDPEAMIAALGRLARLTNSGLRWNKTAGFVLTHPSMERRALRLARDFQIAPERAIAILEDPELIHDSSQDVERLYAAVADPAPGAPQAPAGPAPDPAIFAVDSVLTRPETQHFAKQISWITEGTIVLTVVGVSFLADWLFASALLGQTESGSNRGTRLLALLPALALPVLAARLATRAATAWERRQFRAWESEIRARLQPAPEARFVALRPGSDIRYLGGFLDWDLGFITLTESQLTYRGERIQFDLPVSNVWQVERHSSRSLWDAVNGVHIQSNRGSFSLRDPLAGNDWKDLLATLEQWWTSSDPSKVDPPSALLFPVLEPPPSQALGLAFHTCWKLFKMAAITLLFMRPVVRATGGMILLSTFTMLTTPLAYLIEAWPGTWRSMRRNSMKTRFHPRFAQRVPPPPPIAAPPPLPDTVNEYF